MSARLIDGLIEVNMIKGNGGTTPIRQVKQYYTTDGTMVATDEGDWYILHELYEFIDEVDTSLFDDADEARVKQGELKARIEEWIDPEGRRPAGRTSLGREPATGK